MRQRSNLKAKHKEQLTHKIKQEVQNLNGEYRHMNLNTKDTRWWNTETLKLLGTESYSKYTKNARNKYKH